MPARDDTLLAEAERILRDNDHGAYTVPTKGLYPFQWNWDSCLTALGQRHFDERRAWTEIETLAAHQWPDGMVPHIVFHEVDEGYFPGPDVWQTSRPTATSGITQPPVMGFVMRLLFAEAKDKALARERALALVPKADAWHRWFYANRDPHGSGLVAILHPWESGRDNSIDWDDALMRVPTDGVAAYRRRDTEHVDASERPTQAEYDRYLWLVQHFRSLGWDNPQLHDASPFRVVDPGFNAILVRSDESLAELAVEVGLDDIAGAARARVATARSAFPDLWSEEDGQFLCFDRVSDRFVSSPSVGGLLPVFAGLGDSGRIARTIARWRERVAFGVPSHDPADPRFERRRYWRGPCWLVVNTMLADGLRRAGEDLAAAAVVADSLALVRANGFAEYYDPTDGAALGGGHFTWTAAMAIELLLYGPKGRGVMRIVGFGAHPDDVEIVFFGTLAAAQAAGAEIGWVIVTDGSRGGDEPAGALREKRRQEATTAAALLGVKPVFLDRADGDLASDTEASGIVETEILRLKPDLVITHAPNDYHPDHRALSRLVSDVARYRAPVLFADTILGVGFQPSHYVDIAAHFPTKLKAIRAHNSQRPERFVAAAETWNRFRSLQCNVADGYAEAFRFEPIYPFSDIRALLPAAPAVRPLTVVTRD